MKTKKKTKKAINEQPDPASVDNAGPETTGNPENPDVEYVLKASQSLLQTTLDTSFNYIQVFKAVRNEQGKIIDFVWILNNRRIIEKEGDRVGKSLLEINPGVLPSGLFENFVQVTETGVPQINEAYYNYEGYEDWFHQSIAKLDDGFVLTGEIITDRKKAEQEIHYQTIALKENKELLQKISEAVPDMISVQEYPSRKMIYFNRESYNLNGFSVDELSKMTVEERHNLIHPDDKEPLKKYIEEFVSLLDDELATIEYRSLNRQGKWVWLQARGKVFERDEQGNPKSIVNVIQNITAQKETEEEIARINTELKNFNAITTDNYTEALRHIYINLESIVTTDARNLSDTSKGNLRKAQASIQKMKLLTNDIHNYLELYDTEIKKQLMHPGIILQNIIDKMKEKIIESKAEIEIPKFPTIDIDLSLFTRLMTLLIDNSIKFRKNSEHPVIKIAYNKTNELQNAPGALNGKHYDIISVSDNGIGFEYTNKIFELFTQLPNKEKHKGSGMGLAICKKIMEMHGGFITAETEVGTGTSMHCYFPS